MVDHGRRLAEHEHADDADEHECDVLLVPALAHLGSLSLALFQRLDELHVQEAETQQWPAVHDDYVHDVGVHDAIGLVAAERADAEGVARLVEANAVLEVRVLEEARDVVHNSEDDNGGDVNPHLTLVARPDRTVWSAHGEEAL